MNEFFGMTIERVQEIQAQLIAIGESLMPYQETAAALVGEQDANAPIANEAEAALITASGLLARLIQGLGEAAFFAEGIQCYIEEEALDNAFIERAACLVVSGYGGMRSPEEPFANSLTKPHPIETTGLVGLGEFLSGLGVVIISEGVPTPEAAAPGA